MAEHATTNIAVNAAVQEKEEIWLQHNLQWRQPAQIVSQWQDAAAVDPRLLEVEVHGAFWETLARLGITLLVGREYEHLLLALSAQGQPRVSFMPVPHPSGITVNRGNNAVYVASTRNPNQIYELRAATGMLERSDSERTASGAQPLVPVRSTFVPGCLYLHDLAFIGDDLYGNAVGQNSIVRFDHTGHRPVWWPRCIEDGGTPRLDRNYIQLNSIAAGATIDRSFFTASSAERGATYPGDLAYPVDRRGVLFDGATREPICRNLTRPHSARLDTSQTVWLDNSGYGEFGRVASGAFDAICKLPGWTRGLSLVGADVAFVGTSRVLPKFTAYAPGLDINESVCAVHALDLKTGNPLGSIVFPYGNQIFAIEWLPAEVSDGLPFLAAGWNSAASEGAAKSLFYSFLTEDTGG